MMRDDLLKLIAGAIRQHKTCMSEREAKTIADSILRDMKAAQLAIVKRQRQ